MPAACLRALFHGFITDGDPFFTEALGCAAGQFSDLTGDAGTHHLSAAALARPDPGSLALLDFGSVGIV